MEEIKFEKRLQDLFKKSSVELPGLPDIRGMSYDFFKAAVAKMMDEAYFHGKMEVEKGLKELLG